VVGLGCSSSGMAAKLHDILNAVPSRVSILMVEDDTLIRQVAAEMLRDAGFDVVEASGRREAAGALDGAPSPFAAAIMDFTLPDGTAEELARDLRKQCPDLPLVIASGHAEPDLRQRFIGTDRIGFVAKPYESRALIGALLGLGVSVSAPLLGK
jgi:CheY-like chemotaxis protein